MLETALCILASLAAFWTGYALGRMHGGDEQCELVTVWRDDDGNPFKKLTRRGDDEMCMGMSILPPNAYHMQARNGEHDHDATA